MSIVPVLTLPHTPEHVAKALLEAGLQGCHPLQVDITLPLSFHQCSFLPSTLKPSSCSFYLKKEYMKYLEMLSLPRSGPLIVIHKNCVYSIPRVRRAWSLGQKHRSHGFQKKKKKVEFYIKNEKRLHITGRE